jgi:hypothetical protein
MSLDNIKIEFMDDEDDISDLEQLLNESESENDLLDTLSCENYRESLLESNSCTCPQKKCLTLAKFNDDIIKSLTNQIFYLPTNTKNILFYSCVKIHNLYVNTCVRTIFY